jgi:hypothetical protein
MRTLMLRTSWCPTALACRRFVGLGGTKESIGIGGAVPGKVKKATADGQFAPLVVAVFNLASTRGASDGRWCRGPGEAQPDAGKLERPATTARRPSARA